MDAVDELRNPALADAAPHELDVSKVVVVAKDGHAPIARPEAAQSFDEPPRVKLSGRVAREVAGYGDEVGALLVDLLDQPVQALGLRPVVEVEVAELDQPVAVELGCQPGQCKLHGPNLHPAGSSTRGSAVAAATLLPRFASRSATSGGPRSFVTPPGWGCLRPGSRTSCGRCSPSRAPPRRCGRHRRG